MNSASFRTLATLILLGALSGCGGDEGGSKPTATADTGTASEDTGEGEVSDNTDTATQDDAGGAQDSGAASDTGSSGQTDGGASDAGTADAGGACPGGDNCPCTDNGACNSGICLDTHEGKRCAKKCTDTCASGYTCKDIGDGTPLFYCVSSQLTLCSPCQFNSDCQVNGVTSLCVDYGAEGKFCGSPCKADADCPTDYTCADEKDGAGKTVKQCKRKEGKGQTCACSDWAKASGLETECVTSNEFGSCKAKRKCDSAGLTKCAAKTPASEVCNTLDDDCDGKTDNLAKDFPCTIKAFEDSGSKSACKADGDCKTSGEACDTGSGTCKKLIGSCPGKAACSDKGALLCTGAATPKPEVCNNTDDDCDGKTDEDFAWDGGAAGKLIVGQACGVGVCAGGKVACDGTTKAICDSLGKSGKESCDGLDNDCNGKKDDAACEDNDACTEDICDATAKTCSNKAKVDCDDNNVCTNDSCDKITAKCINSDHQGSCDDGNACTASDKCGKHPTTGKFTCLPGTDKPKCDDSNPCTDDICDTQKGCQNKPNSGTQPCYTGAKDTKNVGECKEGKSLCKDGKLQGACTDEVTPKAKELCDGKDHTCNGVKDEGCAPKAVKVTFANARVAGKSGKLDVDILVGQSGAVGTSSGSKYNLRLGFLAWLKTLAK
ncbi:MAG: hypothetical protein KC502_11575 [Myxococcales bacterium]|nr:hypothetical protein [Myxococcales bacterium]